MKWAHHGVVESVFSERRQVVGNAFGIADKRRKRIVWDALVSDGERKRCCVWWCKRCLPPPAIQSWVSLTPCASMTQSELALGMSDAD